MIGWVDVETSGLEKDDQLLEIAIVITDDDLKPLGSVSSVIHHLDYTWLDRIKAQPEVFEMHRDSGLIADVLGSNQDRRLMHVLEECDRLFRSFDLDVTDEVSLPMAGSSVQFDRGVLQRWATPIVEDYFHYRNIDVSTIKELAKRWIPNHPVIAELAARPKKHRALDDVYASIDELTAYVKCGFINPSLLTPMGATLDGMTGGGVMAMPRADA